MNKEYRSLVTPILQQYTIKSDILFWKKTRETKILYTDKFRSSIKRIKEILCITNLEYESVLLLSENSQEIKDSISVHLVERKEVTSLSDSEESYRILINEYGVSIFVSNIETLLHAFYTLEQLLEKSNNCLCYGEIIDYPNLKERRLHLDMGRKFFSKEWIIERIKQLSKLKINTLQLHFSENKGFRIESEFAPEIVSRDGFLTKQEVSEILKEAKKYGIQVIPSLDTPGHVEHLLKSFPTLGQRGIDNCRSKVALDITNKEAISFIKKLYSEYMELFDGCHSFHMGADEYMEFDRAPFTTIYKPVLTTFAKQKWGEGYSWKDVVVDYINQIAEHLKAGGFTPRIWNDGVFYDEEEIYEPKQKIELASYVTVDFWSQMGWNPSVAKLDVFFQRGVKAVYNVNASFFYYVLRPDVPVDGRKSHSFDYLNQDKRIFEDWHPGLFESNEISDDDKRIAGASLAIWCDIPDLVSEETIATDISKELISFATKTWNKYSNRIQTFEKFLEESSNI